MVVALLGALAVGLLAAVDPFEQLKKGTDTSTRNTSSSFQQAAIRYYGTTNAFPPGMSTQGVTIWSLTNSAVTALQSAGELKQNYAQLAGGSSVLSKIFVSTLTTAGSESVAVCFQPTSKSFQLDKNTQWDYTAGTSLVASCKTNGGATACYWCVR